MREAHELTGASISAIRKWYRSGAIASKTTAGLRGEEKLVDLDAVRERITAARGTGEAPQRPVQASEPAGPGTALEVLNGALSETFAKLAEMQERAIKAEAEAEHLRERLAELRTKTETKRKWWQR